VRSWSINYELNRLCRGSLRGHILRSRFGLTRLELRILIYGLRTNMVGVVCGLPASHTRLMRPPDAEFGELSRNGMTRLSTAQSVTLGEKRSCDLIANFDLLAAFSRWPYALNAHTWQTSTHAPSVSLRPRLSFMKGTVVPCHSLPPTPMFDLKPLHCKGGWHQTR
jgi:hypothetical protein